MLSLAKDRYLERLIALQLSLIYIYIGKIPKKDPCGTPEKNSKCNEKLSKMYTEECRLVRQQRNQFT